MILHPHSVFMKTRVIRYFAPIGISILSIAAFFRKSMQPVVYHRYSYGYCVFLGVLIVMTALLWAIFMHPERYRRLRIRASKIPVGRLLLISGNFLLFFGLFWQETYDALLLLGLNKTLIGILAVSGTVMFLSLLSAKEWRSMLTNYALLSGSCVCIFCMFEIGARILSARHVSLFEAAAPGNLPSQGEVVPLGRMIRFHPNPRIIYELMPNLSVIFQNQPVTINADGFRGERVPADKSPDAIRIIGIGDSVMFGWGVKDHETYLSVLGERLRKARTDRTWEIVNMAVPGYNTVMEVETLQEKGEHYAPDIVVIEYVGNDLERPNFIYQADHPFRVDKSFFKQYLSRATRTGRQPEELISAPFNPENSQFLSDPANVPAQYREMVGFDAYRKAIRHLQTLSETHGFDVIAFSWNFPENMRTVCVESNFTVIDVLPQWNAFASAQMFPDAMAAWRLNAQDPHPSILGHQVIADTLAQAILHNRRVSE